jgi:pyrimidine operon attenuation protein/uracil phosphoribosyltransferase
MSDRQEYASPWQQGAIDRVAPLARELASNIEATIEHINNNQTRLDLPEYRDFLSANFELSSSLSGLIVDYVSYGKSKATYQRLGSKLEVAGH